MRFFTSCVLVSLVSHQANAGWLFGSSEPPADAESQLQPTQVVISQPIFGDLGIHNSPMIHQPLADFTGVIKGIPEFVENQEQEEDQQVEQTPPANAPTKGSSSPTTRKGFFSRWWGTKPKIIKPDTAERLSSDASTTGTTVTNAPATTGPAVNVDRAEVMANTPVVEVYEDSKNPKGWNWILWSPSFKQSSNKAAPVNSNTKPTRGTFFPLPVFNWPFLPMTKPGVVSKPQDTRESFKCLYPAPQVLPPGPVLIPPHMIEQPPYPTGGMFGAPAGHKPIHAYPENVIVPLDNQDPSTKPHSGDPSEGNVKLVHPSGDHHYFDQSVVKNKPTFAGNEIASESVAAPVVVPAPETSVPSPVQPMTPPEQPAATFSSDSNRNPPAETLTFSGSAPGGSTTPQELKDKSFSIAKNKFVSGNMGAKIVKKP